MRRRRLSPSPLLFPDSYSPSLIDANERAYDAVWSTLYAHMPSDRDQSQELKIVLSQTLVALAANGITDSRASPQGTRDNMRSGRDNFNQ